MLRRIPEHRELSLIRRIIDETHNDFGRDFLDRWNDRRIYQFTRQGIQPRPTWRRNTQRTKCRACQLGKLAYIDIEMRSLKDK